MTIVGEVLNCKVFRIDSLLYIPLNNLQQPATPHPFDLPYIKMLERLVSEKAFFFSFALDLTKTLQKAMGELDSSQLNKSASDILHAYPAQLNYVPRFCFNHFLQQEFSDIRHAPFKVTCIYGLVQIRTVDT